ncbi:MAG: TraR/DksA C4-type zinc finger protein [Knoellia sp.]
MDPSTAAQVLSDKEQSLLDELAVVTRPLGDTGSISFGKRIGEGTSLAVDRLTSVTVQEGLLATLAQVRVALAKTQDGTYGTCEVCGKPIGEERLEARPWAVRCVADS